MPDLTRVLDHAHIPELPNPYFGKVRDCYDLPDGTRILISSDRISAFDRILAAIPFKGQVLTQTARFWFDHTADICPNHVISYPDPNVVIGKRLTILPVEIVVRGYLAGTTGTSILTLYKTGARAMYGHTLPDGMRDNQALPAPIDLRDGGRHQCAGRSDGRQNRQAAHLQGCRRQDEPKLARHRRGGADSQPVHTGRRHIARQPSRLFHRCETR